MKILLIAGHGAGDPGACSNYGVEATETRRVVEMLKSQFGAYDGVYVDVYPINRNAYADIGAGVLQVNFSNYDYVLEVHFNSAGNVAATGVEVWVTPLENGITVEQAIVNKVSSLGYANRGVKREDFRVIRTAKNKGISAALIETCFISNKSDMDRYNNNFTNVCKSIVEGVAEGFELNKNNNVVITPKPIAPTVPTEQPKSLYRVKTSDGKQLGAFSILENAKSMAKSNNAIVYDASSKVVANYVVVQTDEVRRYSEKGTFYPNTTINFRNAPFVDSSNPVQGQYYNGEYVIYDIVVIGNRYNWISWIGASTGVRRYMPIKDKQTGESWGYAE